MTIASGHQRLNEVEIYLTPQEWVIRLVEEIREYPNLEAFSKALEGQTFGESALIKPFLKLARQAEVRHPGKSPDDIDKRIELDRKLRTKFHVLKTLVVRIHEKIEHVCQISSVKAEARICQLEILVQEAKFSRLAKAAATYVEKAAEGDSEKQSVLKELKIFADLSSAEPEGSFLIELVANDLKTLAKDLFAHDAAYKVAQERYFDGHPILFRNTEARLSLAIEAITDAIRRYNELFGENADLEALRKTAGSIDVDQIMKDATISATVDILRESGGDAESCWKVFLAMSEEGCKRIKLEAERQP
jgi:hypothetical protein